MEIAIDISAQKPPFQQLIEQIKASVAAGVLGPGDPLPSIRQLANDLELNNKTVAKAYRLLERDSVIESRGYRGSFVHVDGKANCSVDLGAWMSSQLDELVTAFKEAGITDPEIRNAFTTAMNARKSVGVQQ